MSRGSPEQDPYLQNILASAHGSVLEHASFTFVLHNVSRVCCYDDDTDVLTTDGWKPWPKVDGERCLGTLATPRPESLNTSGPLRSSMAHTRAR